MQIQISSDESTIIKNAEVLHDVDGNIILVVDDIYYFLTIDRNNCPEWIQINDVNNLPSTIDSIKYNKIKNIEEDKSLKHKIINEIDDKNNNDESYDKHYDENNDAFKYKFYPEDKSYVVENVADNNDNNDDNEEDCYDDFTVQKFKFSKNGDDLILEQWDKTLDVSAIYDTFILDDNSRILTVIESDEKSMYRISFYKSGKLDVNLVGSNIKNYCIKYKIEENNISIICVNKGIQSINI